MFVAKPAWMQVVAELAEETDYDNFKSEVVRHQGKAGAAYEHALHDVWFGKSEWFLSVNNCHGLGDGPRDFVNVSLQVNDHLKRCPFVTNNSKHRFEFMWCEDLVRANLVIGPQIRR